MLERALVVDAESAEWRTPEELGLRYRRSALEPGQIVAEAVFRLEPRPVEEIKATVADMQARRKAAQPTNKRTFGSVFKNPEHELSAGRMLEACGLRGFAHRRRLHLAQARELHRERRRRDVRPTRSRSSWRRGGAPSRSTVSGSSPRCSSSARSRSRRSPTRRRTSARRGEPEGMARRAALALARTPSARTALGLPRTRILAIAAAVVCATGLLYLGARESSVFALQKVEVDGATPAVAKQVRTALAPFRGESLVALDRGDVEATLRALPWVASVHVDRAFPHRLLVTVEPERPVAIYRDGGHAWLVARSGKVIAAVRPDELPRLARLRIELATAPAVGRTIAGGDAATALRLVSGFPRRFPGRILYARIDETGATLVMTTGPELRLGDTTELAAKFAAARAIFASLSDTDLASADYVDVSLPERVVVGTNPQPVSEGLDSRS